MILGHVPAGVGASVGRDLEDGRTEGTGQRQSWPRPRATRSFVNRLLRLMLLAPDIQEGFLDGWQPKRPQPEELTREPLM
jgi:hypothetical protein